MKIWQTKGLIAWLLFPLSLIYRLIVFIRHKAYCYGFFATYHSPVPIIIVGNISVGGTGKTPLVIALATGLVNAGFKVGIVSRGYKSHADHYPYLVTDKSSANIVGDEAVLIYRKTNVPLVIDADRARAVQKLLANFDLDVIISDDGLQHYALERDIEIAVIDGDRQLGNGWCLPAGSLREGKHRLKEVDMIVANGKAKSNEIGMTLKPGDAYQLNDTSQVKPLSEFTHHKAYAVAGIGNPERFFAMLKSFGITLSRKKALADHYHYTGKEFNFKHDHPIFITEKDAVKCQDIQDTRIWVVPVDAILPDAFYQSITRQLKQVTQDASH